VVSGDDRHRHPDHRGRPLRAVEVLLEYFDRAIYAASGAMVSGHTLKHLAAAAAC
jgi:hypothetical protein